MAWTPGKQWATNEVVTVWKVQTHWTDQMLSVRNLNDHACHLTMASAPPFDISVVKVYNPLPWRQIDWRIGTAIFSTAQPTRLLAPVGGWYELIPTVVWSTASGGTRTLGYRLNDGSPNYDQHAGQTNNNSFHVVNTGIDLVQMTTADFCEVIVQQNSAEEGIGLICTTTPNNTRCSWRLVGAAS